MGVINKYPWTLATVRSSVWLERNADNVEVVGSNPIVPTRKFINESDE